MNAGDIVTALIAGLALVVSIVGTWLSNRTASRAEATAERARADGLWSRHVENVHNLIGRDPAREEMGEPLRRLRVSATELVDGLDWPGLDLWLGAEHALVATLFAHVMTADPERDPAARVDQLEPVTNWAMGYLNNLRLLRRDGENAKALAQLTEHAHSETVALHKRHDWSLPEPPNFRPLA